MRWSIVTARRLHEHEHGNLGRGRKVHQLKGHQLKMTSAV
jgi:hypothetical protein